MNLKPILETRRLILRTQTLDDLDAVYSWSSCPENVRYMAWGPHTDKEKTRLFLSKVKPGQDFAIILKETGKVIGGGGIYVEDGALGWILHKDHHRKGYGTEFAAEMLRYGFKDLGLRRIVGHCAADNYGSRRVMERNGMRLEGLHKKAFWARIDKEWIDDVVYAILAEEYEG